MKKSLVTMFVCLILALSVNAQELLSKNGDPILPKKGDYSIGIGAKPLLDFIFNAFKINSAYGFSTSGLWDFPDNSRWSIFGKYFLDDKTAIRGNLLLGFGSKTEVDYSLKNGTETSEVVEDQWTHRSSSFYLSAGLEKRRGYKRLQGFYGCEFSISMVGGYKDTYKYGNQILQSYKYPYRTNFNDNAGEGSYLLTNSVNSIFGIGLGTFVGVEYFIAPKISIGGQFQFGLGLNQGSGANGKEMATYEYWDSGKSIVNTETINRSGSTSTFSFATSNYGGQLFLLFYF